MKLIPQANKVTLFINSYFGIKSEIRQYLQIN